MNSQPVHIHISQIFEDQDKLNNHANFTTSNREWLDPGLMLLYSFPLSFIDCHKKL